MARTARSLAAASATALVIALYACTGGGGTPATVTTGPERGGAPRASAPGTAADAGVHVVGAPVDVQTGLKSPWSMLRLPDGSTLVSERDTGRVREVLPGAHGMRTVGTVPGVVHAGEGGLLGLAAPGTAGRAAKTQPRFVYAYLTTATDNRVVRMPLSGTAGHHRLGAPQPILTGIPKAEFHDGGRLAFGPDGMLYVTVGDAGNGPDAQSLRSLSGKILRLTPTGGIPPDNPFPGSPVYSLGHRNPQGIAWDSHGTLWASEFGQNTWDELNIIKPGADYGWPVVEGIGHNPEYTDPVYQWPTSQASPSGIAIVHDTIFMAGLGGRRLWTIHPTDGGAPVTVTSSTDALGRLRDVLVDSGTTLWLLTNNTDGRGSPRPGDDRIVKVRLSR